MLIALQTDSRTERIEREGVLQFDNSLDDDVTHLPEHRTVQGHRSVCLIFDSAVVYAILRSIYRTCRQSRKEDQAIRWTGLLRVLQSIGPQ